MPNPSVVVLSQCGDYDPERVYSVLEESIALAGLDERKIPNPVLLKPNMLLSAPPERGVTTHPAVFTAAARHFKSAGCTVVFGDSPNGIFRPESVARRSGLAEAAEKLGVEMADFDTGDDVSFPSGVQNRRFHVARAVLGAGFLVNLPKMKTHGLTVMTGALKNVFGVVPGNRKAEFHVRHPDPEGFSRMLADLNALIRPPLSIMDAVEAMEGNGPSGGRIVKVGLIIVSRDPVAMDAVVCRIMGIDPLSVPLIAMAEKSGIGKASERDIEIRGSGRGLIPRTAFALAGRNPGAAVPPFLMRFAKRIMIARPVIDPEKCARCGRCIEACPVKPPALSMEGQGGRRQGGRQPALSMGSRRAERDCRPREGQGGRSSVQGGTKAAEPGMAAAAQGGWQPALSRLDLSAVPRYNYGACIRCYCCQEICPEGAIFLKIPFLARMLEGSS